MYSQVHIQNFRGFEDLTVDGLTRVNLIVGMNNVGKTALLEAVYILTSTGDPTALRRVNELRGLLPTPRYRRGRADNLLTTMFYGLDWRKRIRLEGWEPRGAPPQFFELALYEPTSDDDAVHPEFQFESVDADETALDVNVPRTLAAEAIWSKIGSEPLSFRVRDSERMLYGPYPSPYLDRRAATDNGGSDSVLLPTLRQRSSDEAARYKTLVMQGRKPELVTALGIIDERIRDVELLPLGDEVVMHVDMGIAQMIPIGLFGEGSQRLASLVLAMTEAAGGRVLVDEIDTGLHYSVLPRMWSVVGEAARRLGVQIFATTHSDECMVAAYEAFEGSPDDLSVHRLERTGDRVRCVSFDHRILGLALKSRSEVR